jgi:hypothetical protein
MLPRSSDRNQAVDRPSKKPVQPAVAETPPPRNTNNVTNKPLYIF